MLKFDKCPYLTYICDVADYIEKNGGLEVGLCGNCGGHTYWNSEKEVYICESCGDTQVRIEIFDGEQIVDIKMK